MDIQPKTLARICDNSLYETLGVRVSQVADGRAESTLDPEPAVCWPSPAQPHGGVLFALMDTTMAWAVLSAADPGFTCTTVQVDIHFTAPAEKGPFTCRAKTTHQTKRLTFVSGEILDANGGLVCQGQGAFRVMPGDFLKDPGA
jgi:uncharacterized protein (TIGR00369 family)